MAPAKKATTKATGSAGRAAGAKAGARRKATPAPPSSKSASVNKTTRKVTAKKVTAKKATANKATAKQATTRATVKKATAASARPKAASKPAPKKATVTKAGAKKSTATKSTATKAPAGKVSAQKAAATKATGKAAAKKPVAKKPVAKKPAAKKATAKKAAAKKATPRPPQFGARFLEEQRRRLVEERATHTQQAERLQAEADELATLREPGDVQFDEESGEGDTLAVERERDLALSAQARALIEEIDHALAKLDRGVYGVCEVSGQPIPKERLEAIPWARERVEYKVGGFGRP